MRVGKRTGGGGRCRRMDLSIVSFLSQAVTSPWVPIVPILVFRAANRVFQESEARGALILV